MAGQRLKIETPGREFARRIGKDRAFRLVFNRLFDHESRLRALEGAPALTKAQFRASLKTDFEGSS